MGLNFRPLSIENGLGPTDLGWRVKADPGVKYGSQRCFDSRLPATPRSVTSNGFRRHICSQCGKVSLSDSLVCWNSCGSGRGFGLAEIVGSIIFSGVGTSRYMANFLARVLFHRPPTGVKANRASPNSALPLV